jgi:hypothetical protein
MVRPVTAGRTRPSPSWSAPAGPRLALVGHLASLVGGFAVLLYCNRDQWFSGDEWAFLAHRRVALRGTHGLWAPHSEHWSTGPILIYRALYSAVGVRTYLPYVVVLLLFHLAVTHLLWRLMRRAGVDLPLATGLAAVYVVLGAGAENLLWAFQIGFVGSVALGLAGVVLVDHDAPFGRRDLAAWTASIASLMFSGIGVTMVAVVGATALLRRGRRDAALVVAGPAVVYLVWLALVGRHGLESHPSTLDTVFSYPEYIWTGLRSAVEQATGFPGAGPLVVLGLAAWLLRRGGLASGPAAPAFACALGAVLLYSVIAVGRTALGAQQAEATRYSYIAMALLLPAVGLALSELAGGVPARRAVVGFLLVLVALHNAGLLRQQSRQQKDVEQSFRTTVLATAQLVAPPASPAAIINRQPDAQFNPDLTVDDVRRMAADGKLPGTRAVTAADRVAAATVLEYGVGSGGLDVPVSPPRVEQVSGATRQPAAAGCLRLIPTGGGVEIHLAAGNPMSLTVTSEGGGEMTGYLRISTPAQYTGPPRTDKLPAGSPVHVNVTAAVDEVILRLPSSGPTDLCGLS